MLLQSRCHVLPTMQSEEGDLQRGWYPECHWDLEFSYGDRSRNAGHPGEKVKDKAKTLGLHICSHHAPATRLWS